MESLIQTYPYFILSLFLMMIWAVGFLFTPKRSRRPLLLSSLLSAPMSLISCVVVPHYWQPVRLLHFVVGPEDLFFSFATGGIAWLAAVFPFQRRMVFAHDFRWILRKYLIVTAIGITLNWLALRMGLGIMASSLAAICILGLGLLVRSRIHLRLSLGGGFGFAGFYLLFMKLSFWLFPEFLNQWSLHRLSGLLFWGIPVEELLWSLACGGVWPLIVAFVLDVRWQIKRA